jgi:hypothetical protein
MGLNRRALNLTIFGLTGLLLCSPTCLASELKPETLRAWQSYLASVEASIELRQKSGSPFLLLDNGPEFRKQVEHGAIIISQMNRKRSASIPHGMVHDWVGALFIPKARLQDVFAVTRGYAKYPKWYAPTIVRAHLVSKSDGNERFAVDYLRKVLWVTATLRIEYDARYVQVNSSCWYSTAKSLSIQEKVETDNTHAKKAASDNGYVWRIYTLTRYEERDGGVYVEQESVALSRSIPGSLRWLVGPVVRRLSRELLYNSLRQTKEAVLSNMAK